MIKTLQCDERFREHFSKLHQVFMYITDVCNLRCVQCIYKPNVIFNNGREIAQGAAEALLATFRQIGASKLTLLGGEPTLYGADDNNRPLLTVIRAAHDLGYEYVRLDTNGQFPEELLEQPAFQLLNELAFSLDGYSPGMNDCIRGNSTFGNAVYRMQLAKRLGYRVTLTCCVHRGLVEPAKADGSALDKMISFAESIGADQINFHDLFKVGVPMDTWTGDLNPTLRDWVRVFDATRAKIFGGAYRIKVRLPQCFVTSEEFEDNSEYYGFCPVKLGERVMVHPDGVIRICSNLICSEHHIARYTDRGIAWNNSATNETLHHRLQECTACTNRSVNKQYGDYVPLCFSFKPGQDEFVYKEKLRWESRKKGCSEQQLVKAK